MLIRETNNDENNKVTTEISNQSLIHNIAQDHLQEANQVKLCDNQMIRTTPYVELWESTQTVWYNLIYLGAISVVQGSLVSFGESWSKGCKFLEKLWCWLVGEYNRVT